MSNHEDDPADPAEPRALTVGSHVLIFGTTVEYDLYAARVPVRFSLNGYIVSIIYAMTVLWIYLLQMSSKVLMDGIAKGVRILTASQGGRAAFTIGSS